MGILDANGDGKYSIDTVHPLPTWSTLLRHRWDEIFVQDPASAGTYGEPIPNPAGVTSLGWVLQGVFFVDTVTTSQPAFPVPASTVLAFLGKGPFVPGDEFIIRTDSVAAIRNNVQLARKDVSKINVYPNPYFGFDARETSLYNHAVTFSHLPQRAVIRIFSLGGNLVRTIVKDDPTQFARWDLTNGNNVTVAAAMYIAHITMPDLQMTKILKFAVMVEQPTLPRY